MIWMLIIDTESASDINMHQSHTTTFKMLLNFVYLYAEILKRRHIGNLRTYMKVNAHQVDIAQRFHQVSNLVQFRKVYTKFILIQSGCDIMVCIGTHIRIDTQCHTGFFAFGSSQFVNHFKFGNRLHIEAKNIVIQTKINFPVGLSHTCKNHFRSRNSGIESSLYFATAYTIGTKTCIFNSSQNLSIYIGFHGIMHLETAFVLVYFVERCPQHIQIVIIKRSL